MASTKKIVFIDRDGVINRDPGGRTPYSYVTNWKEFTFIPDTIKALRMLTDAGYLIVIVSNQAGIAKGYFTVQELEDVNAEMLNALAEKGVKIAKTYYCVHQSIDFCHCRKPKPGLFKKAEKDFNIKAKGRYFIGDSRTDIEAGSKYGLKTILVLSGKSCEEDIFKWKHKPDLISKDLYEAVKFILKKGRV